MQRLHATLLSPLVALATTSLSATLSAAQGFGPDFAADYSFADLGTPGMVPAPLGGLNFAPGDANTLWIGGAANTGSGAIYAVPLQRDATGHITGFGGSGTFVADAFAIDGGLAFGPAGVMFVTTFSNNRLLQYLPGSTAPDKDIDLTAAGVISSTGTCQFVPPGFPGAGRFKIASFSGSRWYDVTLVSDGTGTFHLGTVTETATTGTGPEGIVYIHAGNPGFAADSVLICEFSSGRVGAYDIDANGDPILATRRDFMDSLSGAEGAVVDPLTGDFLFSTFGGGNRVLVVGGFDATAIFCDGKTNSRGCLPTMSTQGSPTLSGADDFVVTCDQTLNGTYGILIWSTSPDNRPFGGGTMCVANQIYRFPTQLAGGSSTPPGSDCSGTFGDPLGQAWMTQNGLVAGTTVFCQYVSRDNGFSPPGNVSLSEGLRFTIQP